MEEFNKEKLQSKKPQVNEFSSTVTKAPASEFGPVKKAKTITKATSIILTVVGVGLIFGSVITFTWSYRTTAVVDKFVLDVGADSIGYDIVISSMKTDTLTLKIHNQFMEEQRQIILGESIGTFVNLKPGLTYKISLLEKNVIIKSKTVTTYTE